MLLDVINVYCHVGAVDEFGESTWTHREHQEGEEKCTTAYTNRHGTAWDSIEAGPACTVQHARRSCRLGNRSYSTGHGKQA